MFKRALLIVALWAAVAGAASAQVTVSLQDIRFGGTYQGFQQGNYVIGTPHGTVLVPQTTANLRIGGVNLQYTQMQQVQVGTPVQVFMQPGVVPIGPVNHNLVMLQTPGGPCHVPVTALPFAVQGKTKVYVQKPNGKVVHVPLNAALNMQRSQGAIILGSHPQVTPGVFINLGGNHGMGHKGMGNKGMSMGDDD